LAAVLAGLAVVVVMKLALAIVLLFLPGMALALAILLFCLPWVATAQTQVPPLEVINQARVMRAIPPDDAKDFPYGPTRWLWVGGGASPVPVIKTGTKQLTGDITAGAPRTAAFPCSITMILADDGEAVKMSGIPAGTMLPLRVKRLLETGTTCGDIVGLW
jgi:hypothetical protein